MPSRSGGRLLRFVTAAAGGGHRVRHGPLPATRPLVGRCLPEAGMIPARPLPTAGTRSTIRAAIRSMGLGGVTGVRCRRPRSTAGSGRRLDMTGWRPAAGAVVDRTAAARPRGASSHFVHL